jgi:hypothetical protein
MSVLSESCPRLGDGAPGTSGPPGTYSRRTMEQAATNQHGKRSPAIAARALVLALLTGCLPGGTNSSRATPYARPTTSGGAGVSNATSSPSPPPVVRADAKHCPVTLSARVGPPGRARTEFFGWGASYGNGRLWVGGLWPHGVIAAGPGFVDPRGRVGMKFGWWRKAPGRLRISGLRLDAPAPPVQADVPAGFGPKGFQSSGVIFPTEGCWQVTGAVHRSTLTFVTFVIKRGA